MMDHFTVDASVLQATARQLERRHGALAATVLAQAGPALRAPAIRELLARLIDPTADVAELLRRARAWGEETHGTEPDAWIGLASVIAKQNFFPQDVTDSLALFRHARASRPVRDWAPREQALYAQVLWSSDLKDELAADAELLGALPAGARLFLELDLVGERHGRGPGPWLDALNSHFEREGLGPIGLDAEGPTLFDQLCSADHVAVEDGPLVSVIMPVFRLGTELFTSVRSVLDQTWRSLELLVVDDASGPGFDPILDQLAASDGRVQVIRQSVNRGTYAARNRGLENAAGEFVTFQDGDDWSHPQRLEFQMRPLIERPELSRTVGRGINATDDLEFQFLGNPFPRREMLSTTMFRRSLLDAMGRFDWVRKAGDREFDLRLDLVRPGRIEHLPQTLLMRRVMPASLSYQDFGPGWMHPERLEYRESMAVWHAAIARGADASMPRNPEDRPFPAPARFLRDTGHRSAPVDLVYVADWTLDDGPRRTALDEVRAFLEAGNHVGLLPLRALGTFTRADEPLAKSVRSMITEGSVQYVSLDTAMTVPTIVVRQPEVLEFLPVRPTHLRAERVLVVEDGEGGETWQRSDVAAHVERLFGVRPQWAYVGSDLPEVFSARGLRTSRVRERRRPVVGLVGEADGATLPLRIEELAAAVGPGFDVVIRGRLTEPAPAGWLEFSAADATVREFWSMVDVCVAYPREPDHPAVRRAVLEAAAAGRVVVAHPEVASSCGDAAVYASFPDLRRSLRRLLEVEGAFERRIRRAGTELSGVADPKEFVSGVHS